MDSQREKEIEEEISYLLDKKANYGWTEKDYTRYAHLCKLIGREP